MRLRVLHCIYDDPANPWVAGGGAVRVWELYRRLSDRVDATVATGNFPGARDEVAEGVRYLRLGQPRPYAWSRLTYAWEATRLLATAPYDVAVFDFSTYTPLRLPAGRPVGVTVHHVSGPTARERWGPLLGPALAAWERATLGRVRWFTATSEHTLEVLRRMVPGHASIRLVQAGVPDDLFTLRRSEQDYLLYFGRLDWFQKGLDVLLDAVVRLRESFPDVELRVAGRGKDANRVRQEARRLGIERHVQLLGPVTPEEQRRLFAGARVQLMPSRFEGFGMVAAEAMAAGVPLVAAAGGSLPEVIAAPEGGRLVPVGDAAALAAAVEALLADPAARAELSRSARRSAERFRWERIAEQHLSFLREVQRDFVSGAAAEEH